MPTPAHALHARPSLMSCSPAGERAMGGEARAKEPAEAKAKAKAKAEESAKVEELARGEDACWLPHGARVLVGVQAGAGFAGARGAGSLDSDCAPCREAGCARKVREGSTTWHT